jgi:hypothetical protein
VRRPSRPARSRRLGQAPTRGRWWKRRRAYKAFQTRVTHGVLQRLERCCVTKGAAKLGLVHGERTSLEVLTPRRIRRRDAERRRLDKTEARVVVGVPEEHDEGIVKGVGGRENRVHERVANVVALLFGEHADRAQPDHGSVNDEAFGANDVPDQVPIAVLGDEGQCRHPPVVDSKCPDEADLHGFGASGRDAGERLAMDFVDAADVVGTFATDQHAFDSATEHAMTDGEGRSQMRRRASRSRRSAAPPGVVRLVGARDDRLSGKDLAPVGRIPAGCESGDLERGLVQGWLMSPGSSDMFLLVGLCAIAAAGGRT